MPSVECGVSGSPAGLWRQGPIIRVAIRRPGDTGRARASLALIDTGARDSAIDIKLAFDAGLQIVDIRSYGSAARAYETPEYLADLTVPALNLGKHGRFGGTRLSELGYDFGVLLGRDFLLSAQMVYDGRTGSVVVSDDTPTYPPT